jgi:hypothetical protein
MRTALYSICRSALVKHLAFSRGSSTDRRRGCAENGPGDDLSGVSVSGLYDKFAGERICRVR